MVANRGGASAFQKIWLELFHVGRSCGAMQLTDKQVEIIQEWAATTRYVREVRLFGSRAKGSPKPTSDIDLAITVDGNTAGTILGNWYVEGKRWQPQLTTLAWLKGSFGSLQ